MIIIFLVLLLIALTILIWQASNLISVFYGSPYVQTNKKIIVKALKLANLKKGEIFYDLGCGKGDVLIEAVKLGAKAIGFEISPFYYFWAKLRTWSKPNINIKYQNINNIDFSKVDVVYCYLLPEFLEKLSFKFKKELKPGTRLISIGFPINDMGNCQKIKIDNRLICMYKIG